MIAWLFRRFNRTAPALRRISANAPKIAAVYGPPDWSHFAASREPKPRRRKAPKILVVLGAQATGELLVGHLTREGLDVTIIDPQDLPSLSERENHDAVVTRTGMIERVRRVTALPIVNVAVFIRRDVAHLPSRTASIRFDGRAFVKHVKGVVAFA